MNTEREENLEELWDRLAEGWDIQVGRNGDANRRHNSDPVLMQMIGDVDGLKVIDAGCGTGYLTARLAALQASVVGIDFSPAMIALAKFRFPDGEFRVDDCMTMASIADTSQDLVILIMC